ACKNGQSRAKKLFENSKKRNASVPLAVSGGVPAASFAKDNSNLSEGEGGTLLTDIRRDACVTFACRVFKQLLTIFFVPFRVPKRADKPSKKYDLMNLI